MLYICVVYFSKQNNDIILHTILLYYRRDVLSHLIQMHNYSNQFLPHALRKFFQILQAPNQLDSYLHFLLEKFSDRFCQCNPDLQLSTGEVYLYSSFLEKLNMFSCQNIFIFYRFYVKIVE